MDELRYWMNDETGRVIAMEDSPGRLWFEIEFETYDALVHPGAKAVEQLRAVDTKPAGAFYGEGYQGFAPLTQAVRRQE